MSLINTHNIAATPPPAAAASLPGNPLSASMSQSDFLKLMTAQLQAQDPTKPMDNTQFVSQMAQFSQLSATQGLQSSLTSLSSSLSDAVQISQVLSSTNLVDRQVLVPASTLNYSGQSVTAAANVSSAGPLTVSVIDGNGHLVRTINTTSSGSGLSQFSWDGRDENGSTVPEGAYAFSASRGSTSFNTYVAGKVTAVGSGGSGLGTYLQVAGVGGVPLAQVAQIL